MSCSLPPEILDGIIDQLNDEPTTLKACCLVSKSWIPRTRKRLFAHVKFGAGEHHFASWMKTFSDPSNSPAHHTRSLTIYRFATVTTTDAEVACCVRTFQNVVRLHFKGLIWANHKAPLVPFYGSSHTVRSLRLTYTSFEVFDLVCSFPLLEDLALVSLCPWSGASVRSAPSTSPKLTGSLELSSIGGIRFAIRRLLDFPDGLHFTKITVSCFSEDSESTADLVARCSGTLESLRIHSFVPGEFLSAPLVDRYLTAAHGHRGAQSDSLQGHETQRSHVSVFNIEHPLDHRGTPNRRIQKPSTNHHLPIHFTPWKLGRANGSWGMAGPRPAASPILDFTFDPPTACVLAGQWGEGYKRSCAKFVA